MIGQTLSHYKILEKLGEGGMGVVYKAEDIKLKRVVALKFLPHHLTANETERARLLQEAQAAAGLNHTNICTIYGIEEDNGEQFIAMEYVDGATLRQTIVNHQLSVDNCITYAIQIGEALQEAHSKGVIHRDVKLDNIMLNSKNQIKVTDFGLAKLKGSLKLTRTSSTVGTLSYMAPEQIQGQETDARSDIFSFGIVLYEMLTGHLPFRGEHEAAMMYSVLNEEPQPIQKYLPEISSELVHVLNRALEKDPSERYQNVSEMVIDLRRLKKETTHVSRRFITQEVGVKSPIAKNKGAIWLIGGVVVVLAVVSVVLLTLKRGETIDTLAVLPFVNVGNNPNTEYLSDGITRTLIDNLAQLSNLKVKSQSTVFRYKGKEKDPLEVGKELGVHAVLTGSVELRDQSIIVVVELSDVKEGNHLWGHSYKKTLSDIYLIQEEISKDVTEQLRIKMSGEEEQKLAKRSTGNSEAYQLYLKGLYFRFVETSESLDKAASYYQQALEKDPNHALSYAGLAEAYFVKEFFITYPNQQKATAVAEKAYALDSTLAETNISLGLIREFHNWNWGEAERLLKRAIEINPNHWNAHRELGQLFLRMGRLVEAEKELLQSSQLEPRSVHPYIWLGETYCTMGLHSKALDQFKRAAEIDSNLVDDRMGWEYLELGSYEDARREIEKRKSPGMAFYYFAIGKKVEAQIEIIKQKQAMKEPNKSLYLSRIYSYLAEKDKALSSLENIFLINSMGLSAINYETIYKNLRQEPRFIRLLNKIGLQK